MVIVILFYFLIVLEAYFLSGLYTVCKYSGVHSYKLLHFNIEHWCRSTRVPA